MVITHIISNYMDVKGVLFFRYFSLAGIFPHGGGKCKRKKFSGRIRKEFVEISHARVGGK